MWVIIVVQRFVCRYGLLLGMGGAGPSGGTERPLVEIDYYVRDSLLGWGLQPNLEIYLLEETTGPHNPCFSTTDEGVRATAGSEDVEMNLLGDSYAMGCFLYNHESIAAQLAERSGIPQSRTLSISNACWNGAIRLGWS